MRRLVLLVALVLTAGTLSVPPAAAWEPPGGAVFNTPPPWGDHKENWKIIRHVEAAIRAVPADPDRGADQPEVLVTTYLLDRKPSIDALINACQRGASVRVILDKGIETDGAVRLARALNADNVVDSDGDGVPEEPRRGPCNTDAPPPAATSGQTTEKSLDDDPRITEEEAVESIQADIPNEPSWGTDGSYLTQCKGSCRGGQGSMHTKFYAFSQTGTARNVVMVSSSNLNAGGALKGWNDLYTMKEVPAQYDGYEQVHNEMGRDRNLANSYREVHAPGSAFTSRFFPMENGTKANDPMLNDLNKIRCRSVFGRTRINIAMFYWQGGRGEYMLDKLLSLARSGCQVSIIIGAPSLAIADRLRAASRARLIKVWDSRHWTKNRVLKVRTHNKYVLVKGTYGGDNSQHVVLTGSTNWGHGSLDRSDDSTLNIEGIPAAYSQYIRHWGRVKNHSFRMAAP